MKLRGAVVGVGYLGQFHAQKIKAHLEAELVGVYDFSIENSLNVAAKLDVRSFQKKEDLLGQVDFVHIAASTQAHFELASFFLTHKIPVLVEKPIAATSEQALQLCQLSSEQPDVVFTQSGGRNGVAVAKPHEEAMNGTLGEFEINLADECDSQSWGNVRCGTCNISCERQYR